ncbi:hypothetical protein GIB67_005488, partial [Kingdonia uniflora]
MIRKKQEVACFSNRTCVNPKQVWRIKVEQCINNPTYRFKIVVMPTFRTLYIWWIRRSGNCGRLEPYGILKRSSYLFQTLAMAWFAYKQLTKG